MNRSQQPALTFLAIGLIGLAILAFVYGDFAMGWQPVAPWVPARTALAYGSGVLMLICGAGLLIPPVTALATRIMLVYFFLWAMLKVPALFAAPKMEAVWLGLGELIVLFAGGWTLFARLESMPGPSWLSFAAGDRGVRWARVLFAVSLLPIGLSHLVYVGITTSMVPAWLPFHTGWAYLTGIGQMACGVGILLGIFPRLAAWAEAGMITAFTLLLWAPTVVQSPKTRLNWTAFFISWIIGAAAFVVAQNMPDKKTTLQQPEAV